MLTRPLCVDLDRGLIRTDQLLECLLLLLKRNPIYLLLAAFWLARGQAVLKAEISKRVQLDPTALAYNTELLQMLRHEHAHGRRLWLCAGVNDKLAGSVADHLGIFTGVLPSEAARGQEFEHCGYGRRDWKKTLRAALRELRPHQWAKNVLLFVPLLAAHDAADTAAIGRAILGFVAFCLCASSVYVLNDMLDLQADRAHVRKSKRPLACGDLPISAGFLLVPVLLAMALVGAAFLSTQFLLVLTGYYILTTAYSLVLKGMIFIDAMALAGLYTLRIIAGAAAVSVPLSFWLLLFSVFLFLSLAIVKRYAELDALRRRGQLQAAGRDYDVNDLPMLESVGISAGYVSVLVLALYINSPATLPLYRNPEALWPLCALLLYWITRIWMKTHRGKMHDDPVVFAMRDRVSLATGLVAALIIGLAV